MVALERVLDINNTLVVDIRKTTKGRWVVLYADIDQDGKESRKQAIVWRGLAGPKEDQEIAKAVERELGFRPANGQRVSNFTVGRMEIKDDEARRKLNTRGIDVIPM